MSSSGKVAITSEDSSLDQGCVQGEGEPGKLKSVRSSRGPGGDVDVRSTQERKAKSVIHGGLWVGGKGTWSFQGLRRSKTPGKKGELVEQAGRKRRRRKVIGSS